MSEPWSTYVAYPVTVYCKMRLPGGLPSDDRAAALYQEVIELQVQLSLGLHSCGDLQLEAHRL